VSLRSWLVVLLLLVAAHVHAQTTKATLSGYVRDARTNETLIGATVYIKELQAGATTNAYGFYSITVAQGSYTVRYSYVGYTTIEETKNLTGSVEFDAEMQPTTSLQEVTVTADRKDEN